MELERLGKYELLESLGRGGMGEVWKARDTELRRYVAIKLLNADLQANPDFVTHFMREAQFVASLHHPNIVQIHDFQLTDIQGSRVKAYMVMDYIEGGTLADYIRKNIHAGFFPPAADIVYLFSAISLALDYAHRKGMIHRDIKPANILLDKSSSTGKAMGEPILTDFGIARLQGSEASTLTHGLIGTPLYISPEQAEGHTVDERSDLYALGIVLYEMLTGITPFRGDNPFAIMMQHVRAMPTPPAHINPNIPPALSAVVLQSISKDPKARFPTATAMTVALAQAFKLPVPTILNRSENTNEQLNYNPLQPFRPLAGNTPYPPTITASPSEPFTPASADYLEPQFMPPAHLTPATINDGRNELHAGTGEPGLVKPGDTGLYGSQGDRPLLPAHPRRRSLFIALTACVILLLVGISAFSVFPLILSRNATTPTNSAGGVVGSIMFVSSPGAPRTTFDQLKIDLENISPPLAGKAYYAWLKSSTSESVQYPNWKIQISNGAIHGLYESNPKNTDLLAPSNLFLITEEAANNTPIIPIPDLSMHIYYAIISHVSVSAPTFEVKRCPPGSAGNSGNPCI
jgi:eukaryotic-like serine/threonine-protein kinase